VQQPCNAEVAFDTPSTCRKWNIGMEQITLFWQPDNIEEEYRFNISGAKVTLVNKDGELYPTQPNSIIGKY